MDYEPMRLYWDPAHGKDTNLGTSEDCAFQTAIGLCIAIMALEGGDNFVEEIIYRCPERNKWVRL